MSAGSHFCLTVRFLDPEPRFHGRRDGGAPEWPPAPLRLFQSLVATASRRAPRGIPAPVHAAFEWLESLDSPLVIAPAAAPSIGYRLSVPNNAMDLVASAWVRGNYSGGGDADPRTHRTMKTVRPLLLMGGNDVHYVWRLTNADAPHADAISDVARDIVTLGWGIDLVVGHGSVLSAADVEAIAGEQWRPCADAGADAAGGLRLPTKGTFDELGRRYAGFLARIGPDGFSPPTILSRFKTVEYRRAGDVVRPRIAAFSILQLDASSFHPFDPVKRGLTLAGMLRHAVKGVAVDAGWSARKVAQVVLGHSAPEDEGGGIAAGGQRFLYLPIPTVESRGDGKERVGAIRRCVVALRDPEGEDEIAWLRKRLAAAELLDENLERAIALLSVLPNSDSVIRRYVEPRSTWTTVTPVVLPGYDDPDHLRRKAGRENVMAEERQRVLEKLARRTEALLRKAIVQAGYGAKVARDARLEWRQAGFLAGVELASRYGVASHLRRFPRMHVKVRFFGADGSPMRIAGPVCIGAGRFYGIGLFAGLDQ